MTAPLSEDELTRLLRNLRHLQKFAQPHRLPRWPAYRCWQVWQIAWKHKLPAPRRSPETIDAMRARTR